MTKMDQASRRPKQAKPPKQASRLKNQDGPGDQGRLDRPDDQTDRMGPMTQKGRAGPTTHTGRAGWTT